MKYKSIPLFFLTFSVRAGRTQKDIPLGDHCVFAVGLQVEYLFVPTAGIEPATLAL